MDEAELEEGEACSYQEFDDEDNDYDPTVDPDVALSYIDEKLQDILGHFQKDFEVVTAENLGAKFGDYGSFLPTYQRAPAWSRQRSSPKVDNHILSTSSSKSHPEGVVHVLRRQEEAPFSNVAKRTEENLSTHCFDVSSSRFGIEKNYGQSSDQNIVKARLEMGSENMSTQKMAEMCGALGFNLSPSSLGERISDIEGNALSESPSTIFQIMTTLPVHENLLLSPLTEYLINLTVKQKKLRKDGTSRVPEKVGKESLYVSDPLKSDDYNIRDKKPRSSQKGISSLQLKNLNDDSAHKDHVIPLKKETYSNTLACEKHAIAASKDAVNGEKVDSNVQSVESSILKAVTAVFSSETESNVSKGRKAENAEFIDENATFQGENDLQLPFRKGHSSFERKKKLKGIQAHKERDNSVPKKEMENPKTNENSSKAVNIYKDLFGEMELDEELDSEKNCLLDQGEDVMATDQSKFSPNSAMEKKLNVKKIARQFMSEDNTKSALSAVPISGVVGPFVALHQVTLPSEVDQKDSTKETSVHVSQKDPAQFVKSSKKKNKAGMSSRSSNGTSHSPLAKEVAPMLLHQSNVVEKHVHTEIVNDRLFEQCPSEGEYLLSDNNSKRAHDQNGPRVSKKIRMDGLHCSEEDGERERGKLFQVNGSNQINSSKKSLLRDKEENGNCKPKIGKGKATTYNSVNESMDCTESYEQISSVNFGKLESKLVGKKESTSEGAKESTKSESLTKSGEKNGFDVKFDPASIHDHKQNIRLSIDERSFEKQLDKVDRGEVSEKRNSHSLPPSGRGRSETGTNSLHLNRGEHKENGVNCLSMSASEGDNTSEALKQKNSPHSNGITIRQYTANGNRIGDKDIPSSGKRDSSSHITLKEAKDLKHLADRLKNTGSSAESTGLYFQAALKFLHGASLLESSSGESGKQTEAIQSVQIYSSTGKLCGFCAHEYEKSKDMATAALAYKCMEVAYMRVVYSSRGSASRDRHDLEAASQIGPPGESPLSSASDVDSLYNPKSDKVKSIVSPPQVVAASNHVISAGNRPSFVRLLSYAQDVNSAMEASRKCKIAFAAVNQKIEETKFREEGIASVKRALDFNFQDMEGLLRLVRLAMEAISR